MQYKNFDFLKETEFEEFYAQIINVEEKIDDKDFKSALEMGKILEASLRKILNINGGKYISLGDMWFSLNNDYRNRKNDENIPDGVFRSFRFLKDLRNDDAHALNVSMYSKENLFSNKVQALYCLRNVLLFLLIEYSNDNVEVVSFNEDIYYENNNKYNGNIKEKNEYNFEDKSIDIEKVSISDFVLNTKNCFVIPHYQREYRWTTELCEELIIQLKSSFEKKVSVYFGAMAISIDEVESESLKEYYIKVIDGQQRITTSLILFRAVFDVLYSKILEENLNLKTKIPEKLISLFYVKKDNGDFDNSYVNKKLDNDSAVITETNAINIILESTKNPQEKEKVLRQYLSTNAYLNYKYFLSYLKQYTINEIIDLYDFYANNFVISCIKFESDSSNEMEIFENLNSKGMELETFDMIKNHIYNLLEPRTFREKGKAVVEYFEKYLGSKHLGITKSGTGNDEYEKFFFAYLGYLASINNKNVIVKKNKKSMLKAFKILIKEKNLNFTEYKKLIEGIGRYFKIYCILLNKEYQGLECPLNFAANELENVNHKDMSPIMFYLVDVTSNGGEWDSNTMKLCITDKDVFKKSVFELEKWVICLLQVRGTGQSFKEGVYYRMIKFLESKKTYEGFKKNIPNLIKKYLAGDDENKDESKSLSSEIRMPTTTEIRQSMIEGPLKDNNIKMAILKRLEDYALNANDKSDQEIKRGKKSLEHIMPKKLSNSWMANLSKKYIDEKKIIEEHAINLDKLGNLLIISFKNNSELQNSVFIKKRENYKNNHLVLTKMKFGLNNDMCIDKLESWDFETINDRTKGLVNILLSDIYEL